MKKVILSPRLEAVTTIQGCDNKKYYGIEIHGVKGFITSKTFDRADYMLLCADGLTAGNGWDTIDTSELSLQQLIRQLIEDEFNVYQFTDRKEFFEWLQSDSD